MDRLIKNELYKAFRLKKLYLLMVVMLAMVIVAAVQEKFGGIASKLSINGQNFPLLLFDNLPFLFTIFATVFFTDSWVDEYRSGSMKLPLCRPISRTAFLSAKVISFCVCTAVLMGLTLLSTYAVGIATFGWGGKVDISNLLLVLKSSAVTLLPVLGFGMFVLFIAVLSSNMAITVGSAMGLLLLSQFLEVSEGLRDYSILYMIHAYYKNLFIKFEWKSVIIDSAVITGHIITFYLGSILLFRRKDMLA